MQLEGELATQALGAQVAKHCCVPPLIIYLSGELGSGKTSFARGFIHALGHTGCVKSPTFSLVETYEFEGARLYHFDLYRLQDPHELEYIGIRDLAAEKDSICLIEWPQRGGEGVPKADIVFTFEHQGDCRNAGYHVNSPNGQSIINQL